MSVKVPDIPMARSAAEQPARAEGGWQRVLGYRPWWWQTVRGQLGLQGLLVVSFSMILLTTVAACTVLLFGAMTTALRQNGVIVDGLSPAVENQVIWQMLVKGSMVAAGACAIAVLLVVLVIHRIFRPVRQLNRATRQLTDGALDTRVSVQGDHVLAELAENFNHMASVVLNQRQELLAANNQLENTVRLRTGQLEAANHQLSLQIAEKDEFMRAVSHDLGAPLRNIDGLTQMLLQQRGTLAPDVVDRLQRVSRNSQHASDLIGELLTLAQVKRQVPVFAEVNLGELAAGVAAIFDHELALRSVELEIAEPLPVIMGDGLRLRQMLQNLVDNAIKYMGNTARRRISISGGECAGGYYLAVADTGMGISPADQSKIFCVFRRGQGAHMTGIPGRGVGLSWVKSVVELHGGMITLCSEAGVGSTFRIFFPVGKLGEPTAESGKLSVRGAA